MTVVPLLQTCKHTAPTGQTIHGVFERSRTKPTTFIDVRVRISGGPEKIEIDKSLISLVGRQDSNLQPDRYERSDLIEISNKIWRSLFFRHPDCSWVICRRFWSAES
jgi:hypothetical protein